MKATIELPSYGMSFSVDNASDDLTIDQVRTFVLVPLLRSVGYTDQSIETIMGEGLDEMPPEPKKIGVILG